MFDRNGRIIVSPGPVHVPAARFEELPALHHRSEEFRLIMMETELMLRELLGTASPVYLLTASGTGAMEAAVANTAGAGSRALVVSGGKFGDRWTELFEAYECQTDCLRFSDGASIDVEAVLARIKSTRPGFLALTHVESSTGLLFPLKELLDGLPSERPVVIVDGISSVGVEDLEADRWGIDVVVGASQKALMAPPGLGFVSMSARAQELAKKRRRSLYYFDMKRYESERARGMTPFTPAIQVMQIVHGSLIKLRGLGFQSARERHRKASSAFLSAAEHLSLVCFSESPSSSVQVLTVPERCRVDVQAELLEKGFIVAGGQGHLSGKVIRTGFLGALSSETLLRFVEELALIMKKGGCRSDSAAASHALASRYDFGYLF